MTENKNTQMKEEIVETSNKETSTTVNDEAVKKAETIDTFVEKEDTKKESADKAEKEKVWVPSRFQTLNNLHDTRESFKKNVTDFSDKLIKKPVDAGRRFVKELKADPLKKIDGVIEEGTKTIKALKSDSRKKFDDVKSKSKEISEELKKSPFKYMGGVVKDVKSETEKTWSKVGEERKRFVDGVEKDFSLIREDVVDASKKAMDKFPMKKRIEKGMTSTFDKFPSMLNLPSKKELEALIKEVDSVSRKVDSLSKSSVAA